MAKHEFDAAIEEGRGSGAWVAIPFNVEDAFGTKGQVKVKATFDGIRPMDRWSQEARDPRATSPEGY